MMATFLRACRPALLAVLLAGCAVGTPQAPTTASASSGPCLGKDPAAEAAAWQGVSEQHPHNIYVGKDKFDNVAIDKGVVFYALTPSGGPPGFAVQDATLREAGGSVQRYYALVQVSADPGEDAQGVKRKLRENVQTFEVMTPLCAATGKALANRQFGDGGGTQYYIVPADADKLKPGHVLRIAGWPSQ